MNTAPYLHLYIGCPTNIGLLAGVCQHTCFLVQNGETIVYDSKENATPKLLLRKISSLTVEQSTELNRKGLSIGRPRGYSFSPEAFLYLLSLRVDLFNLIGKGLAIDINKGD